MKDGRLSFSRSRPFFLYFVFIKGQSLQLGFCALQYSRPSRITRWQKSACAAFGTIFSISFVTIAGFPEFVKPNLPERRIRWVSATI